MKFAKAFQEGLAMASFSSMDYVNKDMLETMRYVARQIEEDK
ncbi:MULTISPECIES: hypothetical protein [Bifidobacterium]|nr:MULTISPECIES: hypothetical protein [Bifidobacterium]